MEALEAEVDSGRSSCGTGPGAKWIPAATAASNAALLDEGRIEGIIATLAAGLACFFFADMRCFLVAFMTNCFARGVIDSMNPRNQRVRN